MEKSRERKREAINKTVEKQIDCVECSFMESNTFTHIHLFGGYFAFGPVENWWLVFFCFFENSKPQINVADKLLNKLNEQTNKRTMHLYGQAR